MNKPGILFVGVLILTLASLLNACHPEPENTPKPEENNGNEEIVPEGCIKDYDGNIYETVTLGEQTWMKSFLKVTHFADGTPIENGTDSAENVEKPFYAYPGKIHHNMHQYGLLYNWQAASRGQYSVRNPSGVQGICPEGWHLPSMREWKQLFDYVSGHSEYHCGENSENIAKALASKSMWMAFDDSVPECTPSYDLATNDITGMSLLPIGNNGTGVGYEAMMWSASENGKTNANYYYLTSDVPTVMKRATSKGKLMGVRCVKD